MTLLMQEHAKAPIFHENHWDCAFIGKPIDDRGDKAIEFSKRHCIDTQQVSYDAENMEFSIDNVIFGIDDIEDQFNFIDNKKVLIEATTLSFSEILLILENIKLRNAVIDILYLEPESYFRRRDEHIIHRREFELSGENIGFLPIPGFASSFSKDICHKVIFMAGYESDRIFRGFEDTPIKPFDCSLVFGVPAFQPGWEMNSFANNIRVIKEQNLSGGIYFSSANNPGATIDLLKKIYNSLEDNEELNIAPVGPKPAGIAAALFAVNEDNVNVLYDHPIQKPRRSLNVKKWHIYSIKF